MRAAVLTREYPPEVYGGAGVHAEFLVRELRTLVDVDVHAFGAARDEADVYAYQVPAGLTGANPALGTLGVDLEITAALSNADIAHSHTWYANMAGHLASLMYDIPHVVTAHSLEPLRPWKAEQLGGGYRISSWAERTAYEHAAAVIAVSTGMRADILNAYPAIEPARVTVIPNGIDTEMYAPVADRDVLGDHGISADRPIALFVGRITRQKGVEHLIAAAHDFDPEIQLVLCAGAPDTPEIAAETADAVARLRQARSGVTWIQEMLPREKLMQLLSAADVFCCPSVYEPQGIVNLEAMACETAVVASRVGGIPDVVVDGETGLLVDYNPGRTKDFADAIADAVNRLVGDPVRMAAMGRAGRERAVSAYGWHAIAERTLDLYRTLV